MKINKNQTRMSTFRGIECIVMIDVVSVDRIVVRQASGMLPMSQNGL